MKCHDALGRVLCPGDIVRHQPTRKLGRVLSCHPSAIHVCTEVGHETDWKPNQVRKETYQ